MNKKRGIEVFVCRLILSLFTLSMMLMPVASAYCGDGVCGFNESTASCFLDCSSGSSCISCDTICSVDSSSSFVSYQENLEERAFETESYIVEFEQPPLIAQQQIFEAPVREVESEITALRDQIARSDASDSNFFAKVATRTVNNVQIGIKNVQQGNLESQAADNLEEYTEILEETSGDIIETVEAAGTRDTEVVETFSQTFNGIELETGDLTVEAIENIPGVKAVYPNREVELNLYESAPLIGAPLAWNLSFTGKNITIGILDTGVDYTHPDLGGSGNINIENQFTTVTTELPRYPDPHISIDNNKINYYHDDSIRAVDLDTLSYESYSTLFNGGSENDWSNHVYSTTRKDNHLAFFSSGLRSLTNNSQVYESGLHYIDTNTQDYTIIAEFEQMNNVVIYGDTLYYGRGATNTNHTRSLYKYDTNTQQETMMHTGEHMYFPYVSGSDMLVDPYNWWSCNPANNYDYYLYDLTTETYTNFSIQGAMAIYDFEGSEVMYLDCTRDNFYLYDINTQEKTHLFNKSVGFVSQSTEVESEDGEVVENAGVIYTRNWGSINPDHVSFVTGNVLYVYDRADEELIQLTLTIETGRMTAAGNDICFTGSDSNVYCHEFDPSFDYNNPITNQGCYGTEFVGGTGGAGESSTTIESGSNSITGNQVAEFGPGAHTCEDQGTCDLDVTDIVYPSYVEKLASDDAGTTIHAAVTRAFGVLQYIQVENDVVTENRNIRNSFNLYDVAAVSDDEAYLAGRTWTDSPSRYKYLKTIDGGSTWTEHTIVQTPIVHFNHAFETTDGQHLYFVHLTDSSRVAMVEHSHDGGTSWNSTVFDLFNVSEVKRGGTIAKDPEIQITDSGTIYIGYIRHLAGNLSESAVTRVTLAKSTDFGSSWTLVDVGQTDAQGNVDMDVRGEDEVYFTWSRRNPHFDTLYAFSDDGGQSFTTAQLQDATVYPDGQIHAYSDSHWTIVAANTTENVLNPTYGMFKHTTTDGGLNWNKEVLLENSGTILDEQLHIQGSDIYSLHRKYQENIVPIMKYTSTTPPTPPTPPPSGTPDCKVVGGYDFINNDDDPMDDHGHGTHVAGTAAGSGILEGIAPDAKIYAYKVLGANGRGTFAATIAAIERAVDPNQDGDTSDHLDIISLSLGANCGGFYGTWCGPDDPQSQAIDNAFDAGVLPVVSAGNSGPGDRTVGTPGTARKALTIGNSMKNNAIRASSSRGPVLDLVKPDVLAPGTSICAAQWDFAYSYAQCLDDEHVAITGTSMSAPHVSGMAALLLERYPGLTPQQLTSLIMQSTIDVGYPFNTQGTGRIDVAKALAVPGIVVPNNPTFYIFGERTDQEVVFDFEIEALQSTLYTFTATASMEDPTISVSTPGVFSMGQNQLVMNITSSAGPFISGTYNGLLELTAIENPAVTLRLLFIVDVNTEVNEEYFYVTLQDNNCTIDFAFEAITGSHTLEYQMQPYVCDDTWSGIIATTPENPVSAAVSGLQTGSYAMKVSGIGTYQVQYNTSCTEDLTDPAMSLGFVPTETADPILLFANVSDTNGLDRCEVCVSTDGFCDSEWTNNNVTQLFSQGDVEGYCTSVVDTATVGDGTVYLAMRVFDQSGNIGTSEAVNSTIDATAPEFSSVVVDDIVGQNDSISYSFTVSDGSDISSITVSFNGATHTIATDVSKWSMPYSINGSLAGPHNLGSDSFVIEATDALGNSAQVQEGVLIEESISWSSDIALSPGSFESQSPSIATTENGYTVLAWQDDRAGNPDIWYSVYAPDGQSVIHEAQLTTSIFNAHDPHVVADQNSVHIVWTDDRDGNQEIYHAEVGPTGVLAVPHRITENTFSSTQARLVVDQGLHIYWIDDRLGSPSLWYRSLDNNRQFTGPSVQLGLSGVDWFDVGAVSDTVVVAASTSGAVTLYDHADNSLVALAGAIPTDAAAMDTSESATALAYVDGSNTLQLEVFDLNATVLLSTPLALGAQISDPAVSFDEFDNLHVLWADDASGAQNVWYTKRSPANSVLVSPRQILIDSGNASNIAVSTGSVHVGYESDTDSHVYYKTTIFESTPPVVSNVQTSQTDQYSTIVSWTTNEASTSTVIFGSSTINQTVESTELTTQHEVLISDLLPTTTYFFRVESVDQFGNTQVDSNGGSLYSFTTQFAENRPVLPTTVFGQVVYDNGQPAPGVRVRARWTDVNNIDFEKTIMSLTAVEAIALNDSSLIGYYLFNDGTMRAADASTITIDLPDDGAAGLRQVTSQPGGDPVQASPAFELDGTEPTLTIVSPQPITYTSPQVSLRFYGSEALPTAYFELNGNAPVFVSGLENTSINITAQLGTNELIVYGVDSVGIRGNSTVIFTVQDVDEPVVSTNEVGTVSGVVTLGASATDATNELTDSCQVCISADGICDTEWIAASTATQSGSFSATCSYQWNTAGIVDQTRTIAFRISDAAGNTGTSSSVIATVDNNPPAPITGLTVVPVAGSNELQLSWSAGLESDIAQYVVYRSTSPFSNIDLAADIVSGVATNYTDSGLESEQTYYYAVTAVDNHDNEQSAVQSVAGTVADTVAPTVTVSRPIAGSYNYSEHTLTYAVSDTSGSCSMTLNGQTNLPPTATIIGNEGFNIVTILCSDAAGNIGSDSVQFIVDTVAPTAANPVAVSSVAGQNWLSLSWPPIADAVSYEIYRSTAPFTSTTAVQKLVTTTFTAHTDSNLVSEATYYYAVVARDALGNRDSSVTSYAGTVADLIAPDPVESFAVTASSSAEEVTLSWQPSNATDFGSYRIYRRASPLLHIDTITDQSNTSYVDVNVEGGKTYAYVVRATDSAGNEDQVLAEQQVTTIDLTAPTVTVTSPTATVYGNTVIASTISASEAVSNCTVYLNGQGSDLGATITAAEGLNELYVTCMDSTGNLGVSNNVSFAVDTTAPEMVTGVSAQPLAGENRIDIVWNANGASDLSHYEVYRSGGVFFSTTAAAYLGQTGSNSFTDTSVSSEQTYYYGVIAVDNLGNKNTSVVVDSATVDDTQAPNAVTGLDVLSVAGQTALEVTWSANTEQDVAGYNVFRLDGPFSSTALLTPLYTTNDTSVIDSGLISERTYYYAVTAFDTSGNENTAVQSIAGTVADFNPPVITMSSPQAANYSTASITLSFVVSEATSSCNYTLNGVTSEVVSTITASEGFNSIYVICQDASGNPGVSNSVLFGVDTTAPAPVSGLSLIPDGSDAAVQLTWNANSENDIAEYVVYRSTTAFTDILSATDVARTTSTSHFDAGLVSEQTYHYAVVAIDRLGNENPTVVSQAVQVIDVVPPTVTISSPQPVTYTESSATLEYTVSEDASCTYDFNGQLGQPATSGIALNPVEGSNEVSVSCTDSGANVGSDSVTFTIDTTAPGPVTITSVQTTAGQSILTISWNPSNASDLGLYQVYRSGAPFTDSASATLVGTTSSVSYVDNDVGSEQTYFYAVVAVDVAGNSDSNVVSVQGTVADTTPPQPVTGLSVVRKLDEVALDVSWEAHAGADFSHYNVYRSDEPFTDVSAATLILSDVTQTTYTDQTVANAQWYYYGIAPVDNSSNENTNVSSVGAVTLDLTKPEVTVHSIGDKVSGTTTLSAEVVDSGIGLALDCIVCITTDLTCDTEWTGEGVSMSYNLGDANGTCSYTWETSLELGGDYAFSFAVSDLDNNSGVGSAQSVEILNTSGAFWHDIQLTAGWNLISFPVLPEQNSAEVVFGGAAINRAFYFDANSDQWLVYNPTRTAFDQPNTLIEVQPGRAYWVDANYNYLLSVLGAVPTEPSVSLSEGWNYVGYPYFADVSVATGFDGLGSGYTKVYTYDADQEQWLVYNRVPSTVEPNTFDTMERNKGYVVHVTQSQQWEP